MMQCADRGFIRCSQGKYGQVWSGDAQRPLSRATLFIEYAEMLLTQVSLESQPEAVGEARDAVRRALEGFDRSEVDAITIMVSELVANAVRHGDPPITVTLSLDDDVLTLDVIDCGAKNPTRLASVPTDERGRGLHIVDHYADAWGVESLTVGKRVWCRRRLHTVEVN
jgi:anti-sigma regulatory factor (Ser/Thr protein kinase)